MQQWLQQQVSASIAQAINPVTQAAGEMAIGSSLVHNSAQSLSHLAGQLHQISGIFRI